MKKINKALKSKMTIHEVMRPIKCLEISDYKQVVIIKEVSIREIF